MNDEEIARKMLDRCYGKLCGYEIALLEAITEGEHLHEGDWLDLDDKDRFMSLQSEFAIEIA